MPKPALGKGIRDLLPKNIGASVMANGEDVNKAKEELKVNRQRFSAQGYDVSLLDDLNDRSDDEIIKGIETFRDAIKQLSSAQTVIMSLEGYGYTDEIATIKERIRDPLNAGEVLKEAEELKKRAFSEHNLKNVKKEPEMERPEKDDTAAPPEEPAGPKEEAEPSPGDLDFNADELDGLLDDLDGAFTEDIPVEEHAPPETESVISTIIEKITKWSEEGYSVDHLMAVVQEDQEKAAVDIAAFEMGLSVLPGLRERFGKIDTAGKEDRAREIEEMFISPHRFEEISSGIDELESAGGAAQEAKEEPADAGEGGADLIETAKDAYRKGDLETALARFQEVLEQDPSNAKAKFMIRRISQKM